MTVNGLMTVRMTQARLVYCSNPTMQAFGTANIHCRAIREWPTTIRRYSRSRGTKLLEGLAWPGRILILATNS